MRGEREVRPVSGREDGLQSAGDTHERTLRVYFRWSIGTVQLEMLRVLKKK